MKRIILLATFSIIFAFNLSAQTKKEKITELFQLMRTDTLINSMIDNMASIMGNRGSMWNNAHKDSLYKTFLKEEMNSIQKKLIGTDMVDIYDKYFTTEEIQKYIDFYKSPEGQKMLTVMPALQKDMMTNMANKYMPEMQERLKKKMDKIESN